MGRIRSPRTLGAELNKRALILRIGGNYLLRVFLRFHPGSQPNPRLLNPRSVLSENSNTVARLALADQDTTYQSSTVAPLFWEEPENLSEEDVTTLRELFRKSVTLTPDQMLRWSKDVRFQDSVNQNQRGSYWKAKRRLLEIARMKAANDMSWGPREIRVAQEVAFVVQNLNVARFVDYRLWALLRTFGNRWEYPNLPWLRTRPLPLRVVLEKEAAKLLNQKSGNVVIGP